MSRIRPGHAADPPPRNLRRAGILAASMALGVQALPSVTGAQEVSPGGAYPGSPTPAQRNQSLEQGDGEVHVQLVRQGDLYPVAEPSIYMLVGAGGNITMQVGSDGVLLVNTGKAAMSAKVLAAIHSVTDAPLRTIIDTDGDGEDCGGNEALAAIGSAVNGGDVTNLIGTGAAVTTIIAAQEVLDRMSAAAGKDLQPRGARPNDTYNLPLKDMWFDGESIRIIHQRAAHTDGDSLVYFRHSDAVSAGNIYSTTGYPVFDMERGGSIQGVIDGLNRLVYELMIPGPQNDGGTLVIPNHGYLSSFSDVVFYQEMVIIIRDRIENLIRKGLTLMQVQAARPTLEYDPRYGSTSGPWTTDMFVAAVYNSLIRKTKTRAGAAPEGAAR